jgi:spore coat protein CotF
MSSKPNAFGAKEMMEDVLSSQKWITESYNTFANECSSPALKSEFVNLLNEEHQIQHDLFSEMHKRGWYAVEQADQNKVSQAKQKYTSQSPNAQQ